MVPIEICGVDMVAEVTFIITSPSMPATGPTYYSGGEPAEGAEWEVIDIRLFNEVKNNRHELEAPQWLKSLIEDDDAVFDKISEWEGMN